MNSNYPRNLSSFFLLFFLIFKRKHIHLHVYSSNRSNFNFQHHRRITIETFRSEHLENLIRHRLRSPPPLCQPFFSPGKSCTVGGKTNFTRRRIANKPGPIVEIPFSHPQFLSRRPGLCNPGSSNTNCQTDLVKHGAITGLSRGRGGSPPP